MSTEETPDSPSDVVADFPSDVLEAGAALGDPVPDAADGRLRLLTTLLIIDAVLLAVAVASVGILVNKNDDLLISAYIAIGVLIVIGGLLARPIGKLRTPAVVLFDDGLVHAANGEPVAIAWSSVRLAYLIPGKQILLQLEDAPDFTLRKPVRNLPRIESAIRKGVPRDRIRRGVPPKNLSAV
jgi:hypothetical protein